MKRWALGVAVLVVLVRVDQVQAAIIDVFQGGDWLGTVTPYSGTVSGSENYNPGQLDVINGPTPETDRGVIFFYGGSDGLNFTVMFNRHGGSTYRYADLDISVLGSSLDPMVRVADDPSEFQEVSPDFFEGRWTFGETRDGGVIGEIAGNAWTITIDPLLYDHVLSLRTYDSSGSYIDLNLNTDASGDIVLRAIPEPSALIVWSLLGVLGITIGSWRRRKA